MCFVSYVPHKDGFLLGSNRDENRDRKPANVPVIIKTVAGMVAMPADGKAGGTWIALREDGVAAVLLNGAFVNHQRAASYRHSRGLIIPDIMQAANPSIAFEKYNLQNIEPFTLIIADTGLHEWRWDGEILHAKVLPVDQSFCWSSATLYNGVQQSIRENWFRQAIANGEIVDTHTLLKWQRTGGHGPKNTDIVLDREDNIATVSTTVIAVFKNTLQMAYQDYLSQPGPEVVQLSGLHKRFHEETRLVQEVG